MNFNFDILTEPYNREHWKDLIRALFPSETDLFNNPTKFELDSDRIASFVQFGNIELRDRYSTKLALFEVQLEPNTTKLHINRVALRAIVDNMRKNTAITGAFAVFADAQTGKWRFTFIAKAEVFGEATVETADPKRYTYLFGKDENIRTATQRFSLLASKNHKQLEDILDAFSVEKVSNEFFIQYKEHYKQFCEYLYQYEPAQKVFAEQPKLMRDFTKKLMGRLVFLYFLQKKRWLGGEIGSNNWEDGAPNFIRELFQKTTDKKQFYSKILVPLYFRSLNTDEKERPGFLYNAPWGSVKVPFLNGGLFEEDQEGTERFDFPEQLFEKLLNLYDQYNFSVDEGSPNDHEVGIDPEMLGHIFENLLEENREKKGAFYTPKEIVHYLCQESLWQYLKNKLLPSVKPANVVWSDSRQSDEQELEQFVRKKERGPKDGFIYKNAKAIDDALRAVRICDPAIGSGAFPMGLLYEIFHCHVELDLTKDYGQLKRDIIEHCIYGVDIDKGAVDIAQLRFWLALVVDEKEPRPLPNLDYKIMQGDSLLERFEDIDLSNLMIGEGTQKPVEDDKTKANLFYVAEEQAVFNLKEKTEMRRLLHDYYLAQSKVLKKELLLKINTLALSKVDAIIKSQKTELLFEKIDLEKEVQRRLDTKRDAKAVLKELAQKEGQIAAFEQQRERLHDSLNEQEKPFFLWHLYFDEVLNTSGGFDIVIGNPPYVQIQALSENYKKWLLKEDYSTFDKGSDLYALFYERGWEILKPGGHLAYITSNRWMRASYGEKLRGFFVQKTNPLMLIDFGMALVFDSAIALTNVMIFQKGKNRQQMEACRLQKDYKKGNDVHQYIQTHRTNMPGLDTGTWVAYTPDEYRIKKIVEAQGVPLEDKKTWNTTINYGIKTGFNDAFIVKTAEKEQILERERQITGGRNPSEALFRKMLRGEDIRAWAPQWNDQWLICTLPVLNLTIEDYPGIFEHLNQWKERLEPRPKDHTREWVGRKAGSYRWFETQDSISYWQDFSKPKIVYPNMTKYLPFAYDMGVGYFSNDKSFILTGDHLGYLTCVFNSKLFKYCFRQNFPELLGETYEVRKVFFDKIPIKVPTTTELAVFEPLGGWLALLHHIARTEKESPQEYKQWAAFFEFLANGLVYELYFGETMAAANRAIMKHLPAQLPAVSIAPENRAEAIQTMGKMFTLLSHREHPVAVSLYYMTTVPDIQIIENFKTETKA